MQIKAANYHSHLSDWQKLEKWITTPSVAALRGGATLLVPSVTVLSWIKCPHTTTIQQFHPWGCGPVTSSQEPKRSHGWGHWPQRYLWRKCGDGCPGERAGKLRQVNWGQHMPSSMKLGVGVPGRLNLLSIRLQLRSWSLGPGIKPCVGSLLSGELLLPPPLPHLCSVSLFQIIQ